MQGLINLSLIWVFYNQKTITYCLHVQNTEIGRIYLILYVDDLLISGSNQRKVDDLKRSVSTDGGGLSKTLFVL